jgi:serine protease Do
VTDPPSRRTRLVALVVLSACIGLLGGALAAWGIYARFGPVERVVTQPITVSGSNGNALSVGAVAQQADSSVVEIATRPVTPGGLLGGSAAVADGFVVSADGLVVTSIHAIHGATALTVSTADGHSYAAAIVRADAVHGIVLLRAVNAQNLTPLTFAGDPPRPGDLSIVVAHSPFFPVTLSTGVVSATGRTLQLRDGEPLLSDVLTVDATPNPGEDGAPLLSGAGDVVGVVVDAGTALPGVVALSARAAADLVQQAAGGGPAATPSLGAGSLVLDAATAALAQLPQGALVRSVDPGGPAAAAGLKVGDVVTAVDGVSIDAGHPLDATALGLTSDQQVTLSVWRAGAMLTLHLTVGAGSGAA